MKKFLLAFNLVTTCLSLYAQTWSELGGLNAQPANDTIQSICTDKSGNIYAGGVFVNSSSHFFVAKWNGTNWGELGGTNALAANGEIYSVCTDSSGNIYTGGKFSNNSGNKYVAKWNGSSWSELGGLNGLAANKAIEAVCVDRNNNIYAAGNFTNGSGNRYVAKWNGSSWSEMGGLNALAANNIIFSIAADDSGNIYAAGVFTNSSGNKYVAKWNGSSWSELGGLNALAANDSIFSICTDDSGYVYAGGKFLNSSSNKYVAKWSGSSWSELGGLNALAANKGIRTICVDSNNNIYAAGSFTDSIGHPYVAKWNGIKWSELGGLNSLGANNQIRTLCIDTSNNIYNAGVFTDSNGNEYVAEYKAGTVSSNMNITIDGQANGASFAQGANFSWVISSVPTGGTVTNQLWIDVNNNGIIDPGTDLLFVSFTETDGVNNNSKGPGDQDGLANDTIHTTIGGLSFPVGHYIFSSTSSNGSATSTFSITAMVSSTFSVSGNVSKGGIGQKNIVVVVQQNGSNNGNQSFGLTDSLGNYTAVTNFPSGTAVNVEVSTGGGFNASLGNLIISPSMDTMTLISNVTGINFVLSTGIIVTGIVTDTLSNPIANVSVSIQPNINNGNGYNATTGNDGRYYIAVDTGSYTVQFGDPQTPQGYLITYYNQQYIQWQSTGITVTSSSPDTIYNINAILKKGALITGTFMNNGMPISGNITVFAYNNLNTPLYTSWVDSPNSFYYLYVTPGTYSIQFTLQNNDSVQGEQAYYNQTFSSPGTAVVVNSISDTISNINMDFGLLPHRFSFIGTGNWSLDSNWVNYIVPPSSLPAGDSITINGQCFLNIFEQISPGATMIINTGGNLIIPGELKLE